MDGGRTLVCKNIGGHSLSLIDLATRRETARIRLPVTERDPDGAPTFGYLTGLAEDPATGTLWAVSNKGQVFAVDLRAREATTRHTDAAYEYLAVAWDPDRKRLVISAQEADTQEGTLLAFASGYLERIATTSMPVWQMHRRGSTLYYVSSKDAIVDGGAGDSAVGAFDLASDRLVFDHLLEEGIAEDLAVLPDGHVLVADSGMDRLLEYSAKGTLRITRETLDYGLDTVHAVGRRMVVMTRGTPIRPVLEYRCTDGGVSPSPMQEFRIEEGEVGGIVALPGGGLAVSLYRENRVLLLGEDQGRPFSGFPEK